MRPAGSDRQGGVMRACVAVSARQKGWVRVGLMTPSDRLLDQEVPASLGSRGLDPGFTPAAQD